MKLEYKTQSGRWGWPSFGALFGLVGGIGASIVGSVLTAISWFSGGQGSGAYMQTLGTDFLLLTIPLIILGACCFDAVEKRKKKERKTEIDENR